MINNKRKSKLPAFFINSFAAIVYPSLIPAAEKAFENVLTIIRFVIRRLYKIDANSNELISYKIYLRCICKRFSSDFDKLLPVGLFEK